MEEKLASRQATGSSGGRMSKQEAEALENERVMNGRLVKEISRLNDIVRKNNEARDISIL